MARNFEHSARFISPRTILVPRGRAPFGQHQEITTSGLVQRHSFFQWLCEHNRLKPEPIRFVRLDSEHAQSDGKSVNRGLPVLDQARGRDFLVLTKRSAASGDENDLGLLTEHTNIINSVLDAFFKMLHSCKLSGLET